MEILVSLARFITTGKLGDCLKAIFLMSKNSEKQIDDVLREYIEQCDDFEHLDDDDKIFIYSSLKKILKLLHLVIKYPNVNPILFVHTPKTKDIIEEAFFHVAPVIPTILNIKIIVMH